MVSRYAKPMPASIKRAGHASVRHISAPLKGLSLSSKLVPGDALTATVLDNWVIEENLIRARGGTKLLHHNLSNAPIETLIPYYGSPEALASATAGRIEVATTGALIQGGFTNNDFSHTAFANLSEVDYTVMVNGADGVWSWNGAAAAGSIVKEVVTAPPSASWIVPDLFNVVLGHMNRLFFADSNNLAVYYLPIQTKAGEVKALPMQPIFKRGGYIKALASWTLDGGMGLDDQLCIFTSNGEVGIYSGVDPDTDFQLRGVYRFDSPMSKHSIVNYGGELYVLISTGLVPMSTMMRAETDQLGASDRNISSAFYTNALLNRSRPGWQALLNPSSGRLICSMPTGGTNKYNQMVRFMPNPVWASWSKMPSRCWAWLGNRLYFGSDDGSVYEMHPTFLNDAGNPIIVDVQPAWSTFGSAAQKQFKMLLAYLNTDGQVRPYVDFRVDYNPAPPLNQPDVSFGDPGSAWDTADWNTSSWAQGVVSHNNWQGISAIGRVGAPRLSAAVLNCQFALTGFDVLFETGSVFG